MKKSFSRKLSSSIHKAVNDNSQDIGNGDMIMGKKKRGHPQGHYCKICGEYKANEKFSGKGHATHICKSCSRLSAAEKAEAQTINRLMNFSMGRLSANDKA